MKKQKKLFLLHRLAKHSLWLLIVLTTAIISMALISPARMLLSYQIDFNYDTAFMSQLLPVDILAVLLAMLIFIVDFCFSEKINRIAVSLLLFNTYSLILLYKFFPLFYLDFLDIKFFFWVYPLFLSLAGFITCAYAAIYIGQSLNPNTNV